MIQEQDPNNALQTIGVKARLSLSADVRLKTIVAIK
jgi:hypothetical protein